MPTQEEINQCVLQSHGNFDKVRELISANPELVTGNAEWSETPIEAASHMGRRDIAQYLLDQGAVLDIFAAAMMGRSSDVDAFLDENPDAAGRTGVHEIPILFFPALTGELGIAQTLLDHGAEVNAGAGGNTPLHGAAMGGHVDMTRWLIEHGADASATNFEGKTPAEVAEATGHPDVGEVLAA